jgi:hypothetical protein
MLANREPKSAPGTRYGARSDASKQVPKSVPGTRWAPGRMLANRGPNRCQAPGAEPGWDASKQGSQIGARHPVRRTMQDWWQPCSGIRFRTSLPSTRGTSCAIRSLSSPQRISFRALFHRLDSTIRHVPGTIFDATRLGVSHALGRSVRTNSSRSL